MTLWAVKWEHNNALDGHRTHLDYRECLPVLFRTRKDCRAYIEEYYGYIRSRRDLRREPHCWRVPKPVKVKVEEM